MIFLAAYFVHDTVMSNDGFVCNDDDVFNEALVMLG